MKARLTSGGIPPEYKKDVDKIFRDYEKRYQGIAAERMLAAMMLALGDVFGFGIKRLERLLYAFWEIIKGYSEDAYEGVDKELQTMEAMNDMMKATLAERGIYISQNYGHILIRTAEKKGRHDEKK